MAALSKVNFLSQQRVDLSHILAEASFTAFDFRAMLQMMNGLNKNYVISGFEVNGVSGLSISISVANAMLVSPLDGTVSFFVAEADQPDEQVIVPPSTGSVFIEAYLERDTKTPVTTAFFDPGATNEANPAGQEFTAAVDFQKVVEIKFRFNTDGFSTDAIPVARVSTSATAVDTVTDARDLFFRLGTGGANPDPFNKYAWSELREETSNPGPATSIGTPTSSNPYFVEDANGAKNDKAIKDLKAWMDAVMTVISEIKGTPTWYFPTTGQTIPNLLFLTGNATSIAPQPQRTLQWSQGNDGILRSKGVGLPTAWAMNFGPVKWYLGSSWVSSATRRFADKNWTLSVAEDEAFFLLLQRETRPSNVPANSVTWGSEFISADAQTNEADITKHVKGQEGDFTGIAIGDYVRKEGGTYFQYYRVTGIVEAGLAIQWPIADVQNENIDHSNWGIISTNACTGLLLEDSVTETSVEPYRWFRASYNEEDLFKTASNTFEVQSNSPSPLVLPVDDINLYWLGRRSTQTGTDLLLFRDYGNMSPGEEFVSLDDSDGALRSITSEVFLELDVGAEFSAASDLSSLQSDVFTLRKRKTDNLVSFGTNNSSAWQEYVLSGTTISMPTDGDGLWVRLDDNASVPSSLSAGVVDPPEPTVPTLNVYEVLPVNQNPLRNYRNRNVFLVCRRLTIDGVPSLQFFDGTFIQADGVTLQKDVTQLVSGVLTNTSTTTAIVHNYLRNTSDFIWSARRTSNGEHVFIGGQQTGTGLILDATPSGAEDLTIVFTRHLP